MRHRLIRSLVAASLLGVFATGLAQAASEAPASFDPRATYVYLPAAAANRGEPLPVIVALHGMGGEGRGFCQGFLNAAERNGWVVVAPTFKYRNWRDPATVAEDDVALTRELAQYLDELPGQLGRATQGRVVLLGFSRGAQLAHRFALAYPERTRAVAAMSAGTYTLPGQTAGGDWRFPYGTTDLASRLGRKIDEGKIASVDFWVAVGANDNRVDDVPRQWDAIGRTRLARAQSFARALKTYGASAEMAVYDDVGHAMSGDMVRGATRFIERMTERPAYQAAWRYWGRGLVAF